MTYSEAVDTLYRLSGSTDPRDIALCDMADTVIWEDDMRELDELAADADLYGDESFELLEREE